MEPKYRIRVQAIAIADDDGSHAPNITASQIKTRLEAVNTIFASANIEFVFDEQEDFLTMKSTLHNRDFTVLEEPNVDGDKWDHLPEIDEATHKEARNELAKQFVGRLVMIIHHREEIKKDEDENLWSIVFNGGGSSGGTQFYLEMSQGLTANDIAHELGHYLQLPHTFEKGFNTVSDAATRIRKYVEDEGHEKKDGLDALDGDRAIILDTPADVASKIWQNEGLNKCGSVSQITIPVEFSDGSEKDYTLEPDRGNIMSYFKGCPGTKTFSPQQIRRMRDALELRLRHHLITVKPSFLHQIQRGGSELAGAIQDVEIALVRSGRVVTAVRLSDAKLKLIVWDINEAGTEVTRRESAVSDTVNDFSICSLGANMLGTAVSTASNHLKVTLWRVEENGEITALRTVERGVKIKNTAISIIKYGLGANFFATVSQRLDRLEVDVWEARADGSLIHTATNSFVTAPKLPGVTPVTPQLAMSNVGSGSVVCHHINESMQFTTFLWAYNQGDNKIVENAKLTNTPAKVVASCSPAREISVAAIRVSNNNFKLIAFRFPGDGKWMEPGAHRDAADIANIDVCPLGTQMVVSGHRRGEGSNQLRLNLWQVTKSGSIIKLIGAVADEEFSRLSMCQVSRNQFATAIRDSEGKLKVIAWRLPGIMPSVGSTPVLDTGFDFPSPVGRPSPKPPSPEPKAVNADLDDNCDAEDL